MLLLLFSKLRLNLQDTHALVTQWESNQSQPFGCSGKCGPDAPGTLSYTFHSRANVLLPGSLLRVPPATQEQGEHQDPKASEVEG